MSLLNCGYLLMSRCFCCPPYYQQLIVFMFYGYDQVRFNDPMNLFLTVPCTQKQIFFIIIIAHVSKEYCFLNCSNLTVLRIQVTVYVSYVVIC